jgi:hypothetical protein
VSDTQPSQDKTPAKVASSAFIVATFGLVTVLLVGLGLYNAIVAKEPITSPKVWVALLGAVYIGWRAWTIYSRNTNAR